MSRAALTTMLGILFTFLVGCASNSAGRGNPGGGLCILIFLAMLIWAFSAAGQYTAGFHAGKDGNPKNVEHRFFSDNLKDAYNEGYRDGQFSNLSNLDDRDKS